MKRGSHAAIRALLAAAAGFARARRRGDRGRRGEGGGGVAVVPGSAFGAEGCIRLSFATSMENLEKAIERIAAALA